MKTIGEKFRLLRIQKSWSQEDVAHELGMSLPGYSKIERNKTDIPLSRLEQIADLYTLSLAELFSFGETSPSDLKKFEKLLNEKDEEIMRLQKKIIELMERK
jgi:transcriptional regulator with XRE-family HTH domain